MSEIALRVAGLRKSYGTNAVLRGIEMVVRDGEIRGLLGANGAGKSTLISCLSGAARPDSGSIEVAGSLHEGFTPREAFRAGIAVIYQNLSVINHLTVAENIFLGDEQLGTFGAVARRQQERESVELLQQLGADIDPKTRVGSLPVGERQLVEIAKMLRKNPRVLVLDEPTAALSDFESKRLSDRLRDLRSSRKIGIVYVSHIMHEVFDLVDSVTVIRDGRVVLDGSILNTRPAEVISAIAPDFNQNNVRGPSRPVSPTEILKVTNLESSFVGPVSLRVHEGESVALFGLLGAGRTETIEAIAGVRKRTAGQVQFRGVPAARSAVGTTRSGMGFVPADRKQRGIFDRLSSLENMLTPHAFRFSAFRLIRRPRRDCQIFQRTAEKLKVVPATPTLTAGRFSGGNQQKLLLGRWLVEGASTRLLLLDEPTQGIDIGARSDIYRLVSDQVERGLSVLFTSSDPDEVLQLADRVYVLSRGRLVDVRNASDHTVDTLLSSAHGMDENHPLVPQPQHITERG